MIVPDASVWIDYFNGIVSPKTVILAEAIRKNDVLVGDLIITEVLQGIRSDEKYEIIKNFLCATPFETFVGKDIAVQSARNYRFLRKKGITIRKTIDIIIGTFCIKYGYPILHKDHDFDAMKQYLGLQITK
jgi:predicted nucleic acid-binding protein